MKECPLNNYPQSPGHRGIETSIAAAEITARKQITRRQLVLKVIEAASQSGAIADEIARELGWATYEVRPRTSELRRDGKIADSGRRRRGASGVNVIVWVATMHKGEENSAEISEAPHIDESDSACPPLPPSRRATPPLLKGGGGNA